MPDKDNKTRKTGWASRTAVFLALGLLLGASIFQVHYKGYLVQWQQVEILIVNREEQPIDFDTGWDIRKPCERTWPAFSPFSNPPTQITKCTQYEGTDKGFSDKYLFAIDENNNFWDWNNKTHDATSFTAFLVLSSIGGLAGVALSGLPTVINKRHRLSN